MENTTCCNSSCSIEAVVSIDERGQLVLPKDLREKFGVRAGDKFVIVSIENNSSLCCIAFIKSDQLNNIVMGQIAPVFTTLNK